MGFSVTATHLVFIISFIIIGSAAYTTLGPAVDYTLDSAREHNDLMEERMRTSFKVTSTTTYPDTNSYDLQVNMTNTGATEINPTKLTVLVDGEPHAYVTGAEVWSPGENTDIWLIDLPSTGGQHRLKIVAENGVPAYATYVG